MDWTSYHKLEDIEGYLGWLNATRHGLISVFPVATTYESRPVYVVKVSDPLSPYPKKKIWIEGGIHAREWISPAVTTFLLHQVATSSEFRPLLQRTEWYFVPVANPDGYAYSFKGGRARMWRKNRRQTNRFLPNRCRGIDLNRNWSLKWGVGASSNPCSDTYKGTDPFSEPETDGLRRAMEAAGPLDLFITFHSYGQSILYPWGWTTEPPFNVRDLDYLGRKFIEAVTHASKGQTNYKLGGSADQYGLASGASDDWAYGALRTPMSYTIELRDNGKYGFLLPENQIVDTVQESTVGLYCMASFLSDIGVCARRSNKPSVEPRSSNHRSHSNNVIFEDS
ncbi:Carboxypeptidase B [Armadillidium vulgare]|nr:Carboxypeptidase B [Armadillidium vulgare]